MNPTPRVLLTLLRVCSTLRVPAVPDCPSFGAGEARTWASGDFGPVERERQPRGRSAFKGMQDRVRPQITPGTLWNTCPSPCHIPRDEARRRSLDSAMGFFKPHTAEHPFLAQRKSHAFRSPVIRGPLRSRVAVMVVSNNPKARGARRWDWSVQRSRMYERRITAEASGSGDGRADWNGSAGLCADSTPRLKSGCLSTSSDRLVLLPLPPASVVFTVGHRKRWRRASRVLAL